MGHWFRARNAKEDVIDSGNVGGDAIHYYRFTHPTSVGDGEHERIWNALHKVDDGNLGFPLQIGSLPRLETPLILEVFDHPARI